MAVIKVILEEYLREIGLTSFQHVDLPHGLILPGKNHGKKLEAVYRTDVNPKKTGYRILAVCKNNLKIIRLFPKESP